MNYGRIVLAAVAAWIVSLGLGYLINNVWLLHVYQANAWAFRRAEDIAPLLPIGFWGAIGGVCGVRVRVCERL